MITDEAIKKSLKLIQKNGDLYDNIERKMNANTEKVSKKILKTHILVFSRILYLILACTLKIKNKFSPVKKIKHAQDTIREYLGFPIDIYTVKNKTRELRLIYGDYSARTIPNKTCPEKDTLLKNLKKLLDFCTKFEINNIYINQSYLYNYVEKDLLLELKRTFYSYLIEYNEYTDAFDYSLLSLDKVQLATIIKEVEKSNYDPTFITSLQEKIQDDIVVKAIKEFKYDNNINKLLEIVKNRLILTINSEGISKEREYGKIYENVEISEQYVKLSISNSNGNIIEQSIMTLYDYLEINDFRSLKNSIDTLDDNRETKLISLLYLYLLGERPQNETKEKETSTSFYDFIYNNYKNKKPFQKIPWIRTKTEKFKSELWKIGVAIGTVCGLFILILLISIIPYTFYNMESAVYQTYDYIMDSISNLYEKSWEFEKSIIDIIKNTIEKFLPDTSTEDMAERSQELMHKPSNTNECVAEIEWFTKEKMPVYFVDKYAYYGMYYGEDINYSYRIEKVNSSFIEDLRPMFQIKAAIPEASIDNSVANGNLNIPLDLYPVGDNYALTQLYIIDDKDPAKVLHVDADWYNTSNGALTDEEKELLSSMEHPMGYYIYGLNKENNISFFSENNIIYSDKYTRDEIKDAIVKGLGLKENATIEEINEAIANKDYTKTPLTYSIKELSELEYYEKIASLKSVNIDLAMLLTIGANKDLIYTIGYKNADENDQITIDEAYIWAMNKEGKIVDILEYFNKYQERKLEFSNQPFDFELHPFNEDSSSTTIISYEERKEQEKNISLDIENEMSEKSIAEKIAETLKEIFSWCIKYHIPYYLCAVLACIIIYKLFGKKIRVKLNLRHAQKILESPDMAENYANLMEFLYGGTNTPIKRTEIDMIDTICKEFNAMKPDEIKEILKYIKYEISQGNNKDNLKRIYELLHQIPFIIEHKNTLKETSEKKLVLGGQNEK